MIKNLDHQVLLSTASLWEIAIKVSLGKLNLAGSFEHIIPEQLERNKIDVLGIEMGHLSRLGTLPMHHRDPLDRLLIAQALSEDLPIVLVTAAFRSTPLR